MVRRAPKGEVEKLAWLGLFLVGLFCFFFVFFGLFLVGLFFCWDWVFGVKWFGVS